MESTPKGARSHAHVDEAGQHQGEPEPWEAGPPPGWDEEEHPNGSVRKRVAAVPACIQLSGANLHEDIDKALHFLAEDPEVYAQGPQLVRVVRAAGTDEDGVTVEGTPAIRPLAIATLRERLTKRCLFQMWAHRGKKWIDTQPTDHLLQGLAARGTWPGIRELVGVIEAPSLRPDGSIIQQAGYDAATGYLYAPTVTFPAVPERPTQQDAARALAELGDVFGEFPFTSDAGRMVPIAAVLTIIVRPAVAGAVPGFLFDASTPGTGKSLVADAVSTIATGRAAPRCTFPIATYKSKINLEELEKILGSYALRSAAVIGFDNIGPGGFGGAPLDKCLTAWPDVDLRVLGRSEVPTMPWRAVILGTGNNLAVLDDTVRRVLWARLESDQEKPEERTGFTHCPLLPWVLAERPRLVVAALILVRAYILDGRHQDPRVKPMGGGFEAWTELIPHAITYAGGANVLLARPGDDTVAANDLGLLAAILDAWEQLQGDDGVGLTAKSALALLYPPERRRGETAPPDGFEPAREAIEQLTDTRTGQVPSANALGAQLRRFKGRITRGRRLACRPDRKGVQHWTVERTGGEQ